MKQLPNLLTSFRIVLTILLLQLPFKSRLFVLVYILCGMTDIFDGWLARRLKACSAFGARLDSTADLLFIGVLLFRLLPTLRPRVALLAWVAVIALIRFSAALISCLRLGEFGFVHTWANKVTGLWLFLCPVSLSFIKADIVLYSACVIATISAGEELLISATADEWNPNRISIFAGSIKIG